jgi:dolichyl-diphosphooligosaccharide--protein glycosyltransferase
MMFIHSLILIGMFDPTYAKKHIPIIASVSEHQPTIWATYLVGLHVLTLLAPVGLYFCFVKRSDATVFVACYGATAFYFASVMIRLMLVLAPIACILSAIGISSTLDLLIVPNALANNTNSSSTSSSSSEATQQQKEESSKSSNKSMKFKRKESASASTSAASSATPIAESTAEKPMAPELSYIFSLMLLLILALFTFHCTYTSSESYSSPSIVIATRTKDGGQGIYDDFRGAYRWLYWNTPPDAKVMSWWDYGYQMEAMANRTVLVDNNTWNNTHIATVGKAMASDEETAYEIMQSLDVDYVLVVFGGAVGYSSDDINKFLWMIRIAGGMNFLLYRFH